MAGVIVAIINIVIVVGIIMVVIMILLWRRKATGELQFIEILSSTNM